MNQNKKIQDESRLKIINASGYLFQLKVEDEIKNLKTYSDNNIKIIASEHRWVDLESKDEGFIDTIIENGIFRYVIETKRVQDGEWIFLVPEGSSPTQETRLLFTQLKNDNRIYKDWGKVILRPLTDRSSFCIIRGQGESKLTMLERIGGILLRSVESLAYEELSIGYDTERDRSFVYLPMIITNANLVCCRVDPANVDIATGRIDDAKFTDIPYIQFFKNMSSSVSTDITLKNIERINTHNNRSIIVINSEKISDYIDNIVIPANAPQPWNPF